MLTVLFSVLRILGLLLLAYAGLILLVAVRQRSLIYQPALVSTAALADFAAERRMQPWTNAAGLRIGWQRAHERQPTAGAVLVMHGNAGTAVGREYLADPLQEALPLDVFILEYPGYADRPGKPSQTAFLAAADEAASLLVGQKSLYLIGESLGSGPTAHLAGTLGARVTGVMFFVPFNRLTAVASLHYPWLPVGWLLQDRFPADEWLAKHPGPVGFVIAGADQIIPPALGRALHDGFGGKKRLWEIPGADHEDALVQPMEWWQEVGQFWGMADSTIR